MDGTPVAPYVSPGGASGGLFVTLHDIARFVASGTLAGGPTRHRVVSSESLEALYELHVEIPGLYGTVADGYGYGHFIEHLPDGRKAVWHGGQGHGWMTHFHLVPETGDGIVILTNSQRSWPFIATVLPDWARWAGFGEVRFALITRATRVFWALIAVAGLVGLAALGRIALGLARGRRRWEPLAPVRRVSRAIGLVTGSATIAFVAWRISLPYVDEASIFPAAAPWAAVSFIVLGMALVAMALVPAATTKQSRARPRD
jgi:hypothetical protein